MRFISTKKVMIALGAVAVIAICLNITVTTRKGINYEVHTNEMPLYLKIIDFVDRHYNYKVLAKKIIKDETNEKAGALKILKWTYTNIKRNPLGLPVVDDHVWHIIVRGYGVDDQFQDVFATLCNYAGINAFYETLKIEHAAKKSLAFVEVKGKWTVFDAYNGVYFVKSNGEIATINDLMNGDWKPESISGGDVLDYQEYIKRIGTINPNIWYYKRSTIQSPIRRFIYWLKSERKLSKSGSSRKRFCKEFEDLCAV